MPTYRLFRGDRAQGAPTYGASSTFTGAHMWWERLKWCQQPYIWLVAHFWWGFRVCGGAHNAPVYGRAPHQLNFIWTPHNILAPPCIVLWHIGRSTIYRRLGAPTIYMNNQSHMGATIAHRAPMRGGAPLYMVAVHIYGGARSGACIHNWLQPPWGALQVIGASIYTGAYIYRGVQGDACTL